MQQKLSDVLLHILSMSMSIALRVMVASTQLQTSAQPSAQVCFSCRPVAHFMSWLIPTWPVVQVNKNTMYPDIQAEWDQGKSSIVCGLLIHLHSLRSIITSHFGADKRPTHEPWSENTFAPVSTNFADAADPLVHHGNTRARNASEYIKVTEWVVANMGKMNFPVITFCSENDTMCDPDGSRMLIDRSKVSQLKCYSHICDTDHLQL